MRRLHCALFLLRPVLAFGFSAVATLGVWRFTLPALESPPCFLIAKFFCVAAQVNRFYTGNPEIYQKGHVADETTLINEERE